MHLAPSNRSSELNVESSASSGLQEHWPSIWCVADPLSRELFIDSTG
jgi:hypothetical protein